MTISGFADRLAEAVRQRGPLCVGIDPRWEMLPDEIRLKHGADFAAAFAEFGHAVLELVAPYCACVKPQAAFFENIGWDGARVLGGILAEATARGLPTILDAKRGDISTTATAYAQSAFRMFDADSVTVNPYLGADSIEPFLNEARSQSRPRGLFVLVRTSNPGGGLFQNLLFDGKALYRIVGEEVAKWNDGGLGDCGLGDVGAVIGATNPNELVELRSAMPKVWFLVPGYGAQGGSASAVKAAYLPNGLGAVVNSSRGITFPFHTADVNWKSKIIDAAKKAQAELR